MPFLSAAYRSNFSEGASVLSCAGVLPDNADSYSFRRNGGGCPPFADTRTLEAGQKLVKYQMACAVGDGNVTACINTTTNHGFVLQPSGSWTF